MTNASNYYARQQEPTMSYRKPTLIEREGEFIAAVIGAAVIGFALGMLIIALVFLP
jgi:tetrahydromethanopterin S-methyltransferase subunit F